MNQFILHFWLFDWWECALLMSLTWKKTMQKWNFGTEKGLDCRHHRDAQGSPRKWSFRRLPAGPGLILTNFQNRKKIPLRMSGERSTIKKNEEFNVWPLTFFSGVVRIWVICEIIRSRIDDDDYPIENFCFVVRINDNPIHRPEKVTHRCHP